LAEDHRATVRTWTDLIRRARLGPSTKTVAMMLANYADSNGSRVYPGINRLVVECELGYKTVQRALQVLRKAGLIERTRHGGGRGRGRRADEYQLIIGPDLLEHIKVLSPAEVKAEMDRQRSQATRTEDTYVPEFVDGTEDTKAPEIRPDEAKNSGHLRTPIRKNSGHLSPKNAETEVPCDPPPIRTTGSQLLPTTPEAIFVRTSLTPAVEPAAEDRLPPRCPHGLAARWLPNGTSSCALCRHEARVVEAAPNVIPLRQRGAS